MPHLIADTKWAFTRLYMAASKHLVTPFKELPSATAARHAKAVRESHMVAMRDGVALNTDVYLPAESGGDRAPGTFPAVLIRVPYGNRESYTYMPAVGRFWARRGYACAVQDVRGRFGSQGQWTTFVNEVDDGHDTIDWIARRPWSDGRVALTGESYYGFTAWAGAASQHPAVVCTAPGDMGLDMYTMLYEGGALCLGSTAMWACDQAGSGYLNWYRLDSEHLPLREMSEAAGLPSDNYRDAVDNPTRMARWEELDFRHLIDKIEVPVMVWDGWYDVLLPGALQAWQELAVRRPEVPRRLVIGPTDHETSSDHSGRIGRIAIPEGPRTWDRVLEFIDAVMASRDLGPRVSLYITGADRWHHTTAWPPPEARPYRLYLHADGTLSPMAPTGPEPDIQFTYDPADPVRSWQGKDLWAMTRGLEDRRPLHRRPDVLVYRSEPLERPTDIVGPVSVRLAVSTTAPGTDFTAALIDIASDGHAQFVQEGICRLSHTDQTDTPQAPADGAPRHIDISLTATGYRFAAGHRIAIEVSSSSFDRWDRNLNTGPDGDGVTMRTARQTIHHSAQTPSHLDVLVLGEPG